MSKEVTLFAAADMNYFYQHGYAFAKSAVDHDNFVHIIVWNDDISDTRGEKQTNFLKFMTKFYQTIDPKKCSVQILSHNTIKKFRQNLNVIEERALYACVRFLMLKDVVEKEFEWHNRSVMVLDIDSIIRDKIIVDPKIDLGVFLRENEDIQGTEYEKEGMKVAAGALYVTHRCMDFIDKFREEIVTNDIKWFVDQRSLYVAYKEFGAAYNLWMMDKDFLDWEFNQNSKIWSAKGERKNSNVTYLNEKKKVEDD